MVQPQRAITVNNLTVQYNPHPVRTRAITKRVRVGPSVTKGPTMAAPCTSVPAPPPTQQLPTAAGGRAPRKRPRPRSPQHCGSPVRAQAKRRQSGLHVSATQTEAPRSRRPATAIDIAVAQIAPAAHCQAHEATSLHRRGRTASGAAETTPPGNATATGTTRGNTPPTASMCTRTRCCCAVPT